MVTSGMFGYVRLAGDMVQGFRPSPAATREGQSAPEGEIISLHLFQPKSRNRAGCIGCMGMLTSGIGCVFLYRRYCGWVR